MVTNQEINEAVALKLGYEKVKGPFGNPTLGTIHKFGWKWPDKRLMQIIPDFSTSIEAAWEIVEKKMGFYFSLGDLSTGMFYARFSNEEESWEAEADTAPLAICKAFLSLKIEK